MRDELLFLKKLSLQITLRSVGVRSSLKILTFLPRFCFRGKKIEFSAGQSGGFFL